MSRFKTGRQRLRDSVRDDSGVAVLIIAAVIAVVAFTALAIFLGKLIGNRELLRVQSGVSGEGRLVQAVYTAYFKSGPTSFSLPCPDTNATPTGTAGTCNSSGTTTGVLPWVTLGLGKSDVVDPYGNYYTYIVSAQALTLCETVGSAAYASVTAEATGSLVANTDLTLETPSGSRAVAFAVIGHGPNGLGGKSSTTNSVVGTPTSGSHEAANAASTPSTIYADNYSSGTFDDEVAAPAASDLEKVCKTLTPGGQLNATLSDNFDSGTDRAAGTPSSSKFATGTTTATVAADQRSGSSQGNYVARFAAGSASPGVLATNTSYNFDPRVRRVYMSARWIPDPLVTSATDFGMSFATRATAADRTAAVSGVSDNDDFTTSTGLGVTFRFHCGTDDSFCGAVAGGTNIGSGSGVANYVSIRTGGASLAHSSGTFNLIRGEAYIIEAFDDGSNVWARITQEDDITNTASVITTTTADLSGSQQLEFINHNGLSYLDDVTFGMPMLAMETNGTAGYASVAAPANTASSNTALTVEAWIRPRKLPVDADLSDGIPVVGSIVSKWSRSASATNNAYRLYIDTTGLINFDLSGPTSTPATTTFISGIKPDLNEWTHIAVVYDSAGTVKFYQNGALASSTTTTVTSANDTGARAFVVGADDDATSRNGFYGSISDVRVWQEARSAANILANYEKRLAYSGTVSNLVVNWKLDLGTAVAFSTPPAAANTPSTSGSSGAFTGTAAYAPTLALYFRPFAKTINGVTGVCPSYYVGPYQCDFRTSSASGLASTLTIPSDLYEIYAKVWGAGGGAYDVGTNERGGGAGGFSSGTIRTIGGVAISGATLDVLVGGYGAGSISTNNGAGGGGGSGIFSIADVAGLAAGGGGGASYSTAGTCSTATGTSQCGLGGAGGGPSSSYPATQGPDQSRGCGGRGGNTTPAVNNPTSANCTSGGADGSGQLGGTGGGSNAGGGPSTGSLPFMTGGSGYNAGSASRVGGGGGGGGGTGGEAGGYDAGANAAGYGGGGGAGASDGAAANVSGAAGSAASGSTGTFLDISHNGDFNSTTTITGIASTTGWTAGMYITGVGIPDGTTLVTVNASSVVISQATTTSNNNVDLAVADYYYDISRKGDLSTSSNTITVSPTTTGSSWAANMYITGSGIPAGTTITAVSGTSVTLSATPTSNANNVNLSVYANAATGAAAGGSSDVSYLPSYASSTYSNPGTGGVANSINGHAGAVVVFW